MTVHVKIEQHGLPYGKVSGMSVKAKIVQLVVVPKIQPSGLPGPPGAGSDLTAEDIEDALGFPPANAATFDAHAEDTGNPHQVTAEQVGADPAGTAAAAIAAHLAALDPHSQYVLWTLAGQPDGFAPLGSDGKLATSYLPAAVLGQVEYQGVWDATGAAPSATPNKGHYWVVTVAGTTSLDGITDWKVGDWAIYNGTAWNKVDNTDAVSSVAGLTGVITAAGLKTALVLTKGDVGLGNVDNTADADKPVSTAQAAAIAAVQASADAHRQYPPQVNSVAARYGHPFMGNFLGARVGVAQVSNRTCYLPGWVAEPLDVSNPRININTTGTATLIRVGICEWDIANQEPGNMVVNWGTCDATTNGYKTFSNGAAVASLVPGQAYAVMTGPNGTYNAYYIPFMPLGIDVITEGTTVLSVVSISRSGDGIQITSGYGSPPATFADLALETSAAAQAMKALVYFATIVPTPP